MEKDTHATIPLHAERTPRIRLFMRSLPNLISSIFHLIYLHLSSLCQTIQCFFQHDWEAFREIFEVWSAHNAQQQLLQIITVWFSLYDVNFSDIILFSFFSYLLIFSENILTECLSYHSFLFVYKPLSPSPHPLFLPLSYPPLPYPLLSPPLPLLTPQELSSEMISMPSFPHGSLLQTVGVSRTSRYSNSDQWIPYSDPRSTTFVSLHRWFHILIQDLLIIDSTQLICICFYLLIYHQYQYHYNWKLRTVNFITITDMMKNTVKKSWNINYNPFSGKKLEFFYLPSWYVCIKCSQAKEHSLRGYSTF